MTGATKAHISLTMSISMALRQHLRGSPYQTYATDIKLRVEPADSYFYPDVLVTCSAGDGEYVTALLAMTSRAMRASVILVANWPSVISDPASTRIPDACAAKSAASSCSGGPNARTELE